MATFTKAKLSGSTDGKAVIVVATATLGTTIHTAVSGTTDFDEIWLYAMNTDTSDRKLTIEYGGATTPNELIEQTISAEGGLILIVPGLILQNALVVTAFAESASVVTIHGFVNQLR